MTSVLITILALFAPVQTINGIKPIADPTPKYAQALVKQAVDDPKIWDKADPFSATFFMSKAKSMAPLVHTKYTAAQMGVCGTILNPFDSALGSAIKAPSDRISKGSKDFDTLTGAETEALRKAMLLTPLFIVTDPRTSKGDMWKFFAATSLGMLNARSTVWHISPKQETLLKWLAEDIKGCVDRANDSDASAMPEVATALKGFGKFVGRTLDEATMREVGLQLEAALRAATPAKYRW